MKEAKSTPNAKAGTAPSHAPEVDRYLAPLSPEMQKVLGELRSIIRSTAPDADELISYGIPTFRYRKRPLVAFGAAKAHAGFYGMSSSVLEQFAEQLTPYSTSKGTVRLPLDRPPPRDLIVRIVKARMAETDAAAEIKAAVGKSRA